MTFENSKDFPPTYVCGVCFVFTPSPQQGSGVHDGCPPSGLWRSHEEMLLNLRS